MIVVEDFASQIEPMCGDAEGLSKNSSGSKQVALESPNGPHPLVIPPPLECSCLLLKQSLASLDCRLQGKDMHIRKNLALKPAIVLVTRQI